MTKPPRHSVIGIDAHIIAHFQARFFQLGGTLQDERLCPVLGANAQSIVIEHLGNFCDWPRVIVTKIPNDDVRFVHQNPRSFS